MSKYIITIRLADFVNKPCIEPTLFSMFNKRTLKDTACKLVFDDEKAEPMAHLEIDGKAISDSFSEQVAIVAIHTKQLVRLLCFGEILYEKSLSDKYDLIIHPDLTFTKENFDARKDKKDTEIYEYTMELATRDDEVRDVLERCGITI